MSQTNIKVNDENSAESHSKKLLEAPTEPNTIPISLSHPDFQRLRNDSWIEKPKKDDNGFLSSAKGSLLTLKSISPKRIRARTVLWYLVFCGFAVNYMIRITVNIAIVDMISQKKVTNKTVHVSECFVNENVINQSTSIVFDRMISQNSSSTIGVNALHNNVNSEGMRFSLERQVLQFLQVMIANKTIKFTHKKNEKSFFILIA